MTTKEIQIEALSKVKDEIIKRAVRMEDMLYNETALNIFLESTGGRYIQLIISRDKLKLKIKTMSEICDIIFKQIDELRNN